MAIYKNKLTGIVPTRKCTSQGAGGRGRRVKVGTSTMNKHTKRSHKKYRGQGR
tara:strand:+ start:2029 stop:2187 length:159 start_codon:yes stop_codon:yes gene_type:complete